MCELRRQWQRQQNHSHCRCRLACRRLFWRRRRRIEFTKGFRFLWYEDSMMMMMMLLLRCLVSTASFCRSPFILTPEFQRLTSWRTVAGRMSISLSPSNNGSVCLHCYGILFSSNVCCIHKTHRHIHLYYVYKGGPIFSI